MNADDNDDDLNATPQNEDMEDRDEDDDANATEDEDTEEADEAVNLPPTFSQAAQRLRDADDEAAIAQWEGVMRDRATHHGGVVPSYETNGFHDCRRLVRLDDAKPSPVAASTEDLLNGLIQDCRFLIHELVYHSARLTPDPANRLSFIASARSLAVTAGAVGKTIARLRGNEPVAAPVHESRHRMIVEHVETVASPSSSVGQGEGGGGRKKSRGVRK
jgi:hypothetical protein